MMEDFLLSRLAAMPLQEKERLIQIVLTNVSDGELARVVEIVHDEQNRRMHEVVRLAEAAFPGIFGPLPDKLFG